MMSKRRLSTSVVKMKISDEFSDGGGSCTRTSVSACTHTTALESAEVEVECAVRPAGFGAGTSPPCRYCCCTGTDRALKHGRHELPGWW
jgi:hypothetical protein